MMTTERFNLTWDEFEKCASNSFKDLLSQEEFVDVTLATEDNKQTIFHLSNKQIKAHKVVLSACSPVLKSILLNNPHQHPLIYLSGIKFQDIQTLIKFMYLGETEIGQDDLDSFMNAAQRFQVKGLSNERESKTDQTDQLDYKKSKKQTSSSGPEIKQEASNPHEIALLDDSAYIRTEYDLPVSDQSQNKSKPGFECGQCNYRANYRHHLKGHIKAKHENEKFPCDACEYRASYKHDLTRHKKNKHASAF